MMRKRQEEAACNTSSNVASLLPWLSFLHLPVTFALHCIRHHDSLPNHLLFLPVALFIYLFPITLYRLLVFMAAGSRRDTLESQRPSEQQEEGGGGDEDSTSLLNESGIGSTSINRNSASRHPASSPRRSWNPRTW